MRNVYCLKHMTILSRGQMEKNTRTICNAPVDDIDIINLLGQLIYLGLPIALG